MSKCLLCHMPLYILYILCICHRSISFDILAKDFEIHVQDYMCSENSTNGHFSLIARAKKAVFQMFTIYFSNYFFFAEGIDLDKQMILAVTGISPEKLVIYRRICNVFIWTFGESTIEISAKTKLKFLIICM